MKVLLTDYESSDTDLERNLLTIAGLELVAAQCREPREIIAAAREADALIVGLAPVTADVFEALPRLRMITVGGVGIDNIDAEAARRHGVWVANVPDANINEVAIHALAMTLALIRHLPFYDRSVREGRWHYADTGRLRRPSTLTVGIVGLGRIGRTFARLARPCFARAVAHDPNVNGDDWPEGIESVPLGDVFEAGHVVSVHVPLTRETRHVVSRERLARMRAGSYLVNVSRGALVDLEALLEMLDSGHLAGAALDVFPEEPLPAGHPLRRHPRTMLSPHAAFYSVESEEELRRKAVLNVLAWYRDGIPSNVVVEGKYLPPA